MWWFTQLAGYLIGWIWLSNEDKASMPEESADSKREVMDDSSSDTPRPTYRDYEPTLSEVFEMFNLKHQETPTLQCPPKHHISVPPELGNTSPQTMDCQLISPTDNAIVSAGHMAEAKRRILQQCVDREVEQFLRALYKRRGRMEISEGKTVFYAVEYRGENIMLNTSSELSLWHKDSKVSGGAVITCPSTLDTHPMVDCVLGMGKGI
jgi:hypothetical protein